MTKIESVRIRDSEDIMNIILADLARADDVVIAIEPGADVDFSGLQLLHSARLYADALGKRLSLAEPASGQLRVLLEQGGFLQSPLADDARFWLAERAA